MTKLTLKGRISSVEDISTDEIIAHRLSIHPDGGLALTCISFNYEMPLSTFVGKWVQLEAFLDEAPQPELIVTSLELADAKISPRNFVPKPRPAESVCVNAA